MGQFCHYAVQQAVYTVLSADATLDETISGVFDFVPAGTDYPYITIGDSTVEDAAAQQMPVCRMRLRLHIYSRAKGRREIDTIMRRIHTLLHDTQPVAEGVEVITFRYTGSEIALEKDGLTYRGEMQFALLVALEE